MNQYSPYTRSRGPSSEPAFSFVKKEKSFKKYVWLILGVLSGVVCLGSMALYFLYSKTPASESFKSTAIPFIASQGPFKEKPIHPGGSNVLNQDKEIYTFLLDGRSPNESPETVLRDISEAPLMEEDALPELMAPGPASPPLLLDSAPVEKVLPSRIISQSAPRSPPAKSPKSLDATAYHSLRLMRCATKQICQKELQQLMHQSSQSFSKLPLSMEKDPSGKFMLCVGPFSCEQKAQATQSVLLKKGIRSTLITTSLEGTTP